MPQKGIKTPCPTCRQTAHPGTAMTPGGTAQSRAYILEGFLWVRPPEPPSKTFIASGLWANRGLTCSWVDFKDQNQMEYGAVRGSSTP